LARLPARAATESTGTCSFIVRHPLDTDGLSGISATTPILHRTQSCPEAGVRPRAAHEAVEGGQRKLPVKPISPNASRRQRRSDERGHETGNPRRLLRFRGGESRSPVRCHGSKRRRLRSGKFWRRAALPISRCEACPQAGAELGSVKGHLARSPPARSPPPPSCAYGRNGGKKRVLSSLPAFPDASLNPQI
jgi:hypothetical protein